MRKRKGTGKIGKMEYKTKGNRKLKKVELKKKRGRNILRGEKGRNENETPGKK